MLPPGASLLELRAVSHAAATSAPLSEITLEIAPGTVTIIRGESGAGTRELMRVMSLVEPPQSGSVLVEGAPAEGWPEERRADYRTRRFGFLLSAPFLLPALTVVENVGMPLFRKSPTTTPEEAGRRARGLLEFVGMSAFAEIPAGSLGVVEQHRVALARALVNEPAIVFAEELEASIPPDALADMFALLRQAAAAQPLAVVATTALQFAPGPRLQLLELAEGKLRPETRPAAAVPLN